MRAAQHFLDNPFAVLVSCFFQKKGAYYSTSANSEHMPHTTKTTDHVDVTISSIEHRELINLAGAKTQRWVPFAGALLDKAILQQQPFTQEVIEDLPHERSDFPIRLPISPQAKIALINLVGQRRIAYTVLASKILKETIRSTIDARIRQTPTAPEVKTP